ncbi:MAG: prolyl oligopeptidase family serine peptidase [Burkholderiaceae bacterium]
MRLLATLLMTAALAPLTAQATAPADPYLWLEEVDGTRAMEWVETANAASQKTFAADPRFEPLRADLLKIFDSSRRIPYVNRIGGQVYNLWRDADHPRGLWRRTTPAEFRRADPAWETVLDLDALAQAEGENWVWQGADCLRPDTPAQAPTRCIVSLSRGGADATVSREFDLAARGFVKHGFVLPEAKQDVNWKDADTLWVATDFGAGSMTRSGYPRIVKEWKRGTPLAAATTVFEGQPGDISVGAYSERESGLRRDWIRRGIAFWEAEHFVIRDGQPIKLELPADATPIVFQDWLLVRTRTPWPLAGQTIPGGALAAIKFETFMKGGRAFDLLYSPGERASLVRVDSTRNTVLVSELDKVRSRVWEITHDGQVWQRRRVPTPDNARVDVVETWWGNDDYQLAVQDFTTPTTLIARTVGGDTAAPLKSLPPFFDASDLETRQFEAVSADGTRIPYFVVARRGLKPDGSHPTLLYGYGGFAQPMLPAYSGNIGRGWLAPGGVYVLANLRGGGEFGPEWHRTAQKANKQRTWDDMAAVAEDLIRRGITRPKHLGIMGGSQGGLLTTTAMSQRPELYGAVVSQVPLIDMLRYHKLLAGASWMAEYGDPDLPAERAWIAKYSPYQNVSAGRQYPKLFLVTSTRDDRVHPGHARKMAARMKELGHEVLYFENTEGGHAGAANNAQSAQMWAQSFSFLWRTLQ